MSIRRSEEEPLQPRFPGSSVARPRPSSRGSDFCLSKTSRYRNRRWYRSHPRPSWTKRTASSKSAADGRFVAIASSMARSIARHHSVDQVIAFFSIPSGIVAWWLNHRRNSVCRFAPRRRRARHRPGLRLFYWFLAPLRKRILKEAISVTAPASGLKELSEKMTAFQFS